ncbi:MAG: hypothetical protein ACRD5K_06440 [Candidatus Acidiferrales bacterium]
MKRLAATAIIQPASSGACLAAGFESAMSFILVSLLNSMMNSITVNIVYSS